MSWLWLVSVGVTDVQFPLWEKDDYGIWSVQKRFEIGRGGIREVHKGLLRLLALGQIEFPKEQPKALKRELARELKLDFFQADEEFYASIKAPENLAGQYRIDPNKNEIPNAQQQVLPLYCPKLDELVEAAKTSFDGEPVTVVVLNTRRDSDSDDGANEPIASGPLAAKFLAERLGLQWLDGNGAMPEFLGSGLATWFDFLIDRETVEDVAVQRRIIQRLTQLLRSWHGGEKCKIAVTTTGGIPPLKPIIERIPATFIGQDSVRLLEKPERAPVVAKALNYLDRVAEQEILRFHCAEALRHQDYASAYGLANRFPNQAWAQQVRNVLGPLLELPGGPLQIKGHALDAWALSACQIEFRLCLGESAGALIRLGRFIESSIWVLIARDPRIRDLKLIVDPEEECLVGNLPNNHELMQPKAGQKAMLESKRAGTYTVNGLTWLWPDWLKQEGACQAAVSLDQLVRNYQGNPDDNYSPRKFRNRLVHGSTQPPTLREIEDSLRQAKLLMGVHQPFGKNLLALPAMSALLSGLGQPNLAGEIGRQLAELLDNVIEG